MRNRYERAVRTDRLEGFRLTEDLLRRAISFGPPLQGPGRRAIDRYRDPGGARDYWRLGACGIVGVAKSPGKRVLFLPEPAVDMARTTEDRPSTARSNPKPVRR